MSYFEENALPSWSDAYMLQQAEKKGCTVEYPTDTQLFIDIDSDADFETFLGQFETLVSLTTVAVSGYTVRPSKSGGPKRHIVVDLLEPVSTTQRILLQAVLGSDRKRELLSFTGMLFGQENPVVFFRPKEG